MNCILQDLVWPSVHAHTCAHPGAQSQRVPRADCAYLLLVLLPRRLLWTERSSHRLESCAQLDENLNTNVEGNARNSYWHYAGMTEADIPGFVEVLQVGPSCSFMCKLSFSDNVDVDWGGRQFTCVCAYFS